MDNAGIYTLAALGVTTALTAQAQTSIEDLDGMSSVNLVASFAYGSGGSTCRVLVQTTFDGTNWLDIARFEFTTTSATKYAPLFGFAGTGQINDYAALSASGAVDSLLGNKLRAVVTSTGTYVATTISVRAAVR